MSEWVSEWVSELESEWVSFLRQSNSSWHMQTFIWSKSILFLFFAFRFSLFSFRISLFDNRCASVLTVKYLSTWVSECVIERVSELESECFTSSNSSCNEQTFILSKSRSFLFFAFRFSFFAFRFSFFTFRFSFFAFCFSITGLCHVVTVICVHEWVSVWVSEWVRKWVSGCFTSFKQLMAYADVHLVKVKILFVFRFSLFVFRFSFFAFQFSLFDNRSASCFYCLVSEYMSEWVCALASEWVRKWVSVLRQSNSSCHMQTFISSKSRFFLFFAFRFSFFAFRFSSLFVFRFSLFVFRFSLFNHRSVSCCNCYLHTWIRECLNKWVRKWVSECFTSIKQLMPYADVHSVIVKILFCFSLFAFVFRFSFFAFRFSLFDDRSASCFYCLVSEYMSGWVCKWASELFDWRKTLTHFLTHSLAHSHTHSLLYSDTKQ